MGESDETSRGEPTYAYKPSLMGAPWGFRLTPAGLAWGIGGRTGIVSYQDIRRIRLSYRPATMQQYRFLTEIWSAKTPKLSIASSSWRSMTEQERLDDRYTAFICALHAHIADAAAQPKLDAGSPAFLYWPGIVIFVALAIGLVALIVQALQQAQLSATLFLAGFFGLLLWQLGGFFRRNRPRPYQLTDIPTDILPSQQPGAATKI